MVDNYPSFVRISLHQLSHYWCRLLWPDILLLLISGPDHDDVINIWCQTPGAGQTPAEEEPQCDHHHPQPQEARPHLNNNNNNNENNENDNKGPTILSSRVLKPLSPSPTEVMITPTATSMKPRYSKMLMSASSDQRLHFTKTWNGVNFGLHLLLSPRCQYQCFPSPHHWSAFPYSDLSKI